MEAVKLTNDHVKLAAKKLGLSNDCLPKIIHVTGTNGKGSVIAYINSILQASDKKVHAYTSPHLINVNERIQVANETISDEQYEYYMKQVRGLLPKTLASDFENRTLAALLAFSETPADLALLEVGIGGRCDATNILDNCLAAVFTPIGLDHQQYLGNSIAKIAWEKAHIIKQGCSVFSARQTLEGLTVLTEFSDKREATIKVSSRKKFGSQGYEFPKLIGDYQLDNASLAIDIVENLYPNITKSQINKGLQNVCWPGRLQKTIYNNVEIWCDAAHNSHSALMLSNEWYNLYNKDENTVMYISLQENRDISEFLQPFKDIIKTIRPIIIPPKYLGDFEIRWHNFDKIAAIANNIGFKVLSAEPLMTGLEKIQKDTSILLTGSQYIVGDYFKEGLGIKCLTKISPLA